MTKTVPVVSYLVLDDEPYLQANACANCGAFYFDRRNACAKCSQTRFAKSRLSSEGVVRAFTVVMRGAKSGPYTSAVIALSGGGTVKANLIGVTDPSQIHPDMRVRMVTFEAGTDDEGTVAVAFGYEPIGV